MNKKHIITAIAISISLYANAEPNVCRTPLELQTQYRVATTNNTERAFLLGITTDEWMALCDDAVSIATTNKAEAVKKLNGGHWICYRNATNEMWKPSDINFVKAMTEKLPLIAPIIEDCDEKCASIGVCTDINLYASFPQCTEQWLVNEKNENWVNAHPARVAFTRLHKDGNWRAASWSVPEAINVFAEDYYISPEKAMEAIVNDVQLIIKRKLRLDGKTFITKEGVNPVQNAIDDLCDGFNTPMRSGLKEWTAKWIPDYEWIDSPELSEIKIKEFTDKIFYGETPLDNRNQPYLRYILGLDGYNDFVKRYNGEE